MTPGDWHRKHILHATFMLSGQVYEKTMLGYKTEKLKEEGEEGRQNVPSGSSLRLLG